MSAILPGLQAFSSAFNRIAMKKLLYILAGLGLAACTSDIEELPEVGPQPGREVALTGISGTASRTQFVPGDGTEIQFQWSTGDRIWAGGVQSAEAGTADKFPVKPFLPYNNTLYYGLTINPVNSEVYIADAIDYVQNGVVLRYSPDGELLDEFYVGIIPGAFCWR